MITAGEIYDHIDSFAPFDTAMGFDNVGLLIGSRSCRTERVLIALDITENVIREAQEKNASVVITHHPVIFQPLRTIMTDSIPYACVRAGITVISAHTNLDVAKGGVNDTLAQLIGVSSENGTDEDCVLFGELDRECAAQELAGRIKNSLGCCGLRFTGRNGTIRKVAVACGAGGSAVFAAAAAGMDALVTGEIKHHELLFAAQKNIAVFDTGHFRSEDMVIPALAARLSKRFPEAVFEQAESDRENIQYI